MDISVPLHAVTLFVVEGASVANETHWWEIATGIIGVPTAIIGVRYAYQLTQKTRLEITKTELEIEEKRRSLSSSPASVPAPAPVDVAPAAVQGRITDYLILRLIILYAFNTLWGLALGAFKSVAIGVMFVAMKVFGIEGKLGNLFENPELLYGGAYAVSLVPDIVHWTIMFALTWPLFKDVNRALGMRFADYLPWKRKS